MTLHVINKTDAALWQLLLNAVMPADAVLLIEDAVYAALPGYPLVTDLLATYPALQFHVLADDLAARGISAKIRPGFACVTCSEFVALTIDHARVVNWH